MFVNALGIYFFTVFIYTDMLYISIIKYDKNIILFIFSQRNAYVCRILSNRFVGNIRIIINKPVNRAKCPDNPIYLISSALSFLIFFHLKRHIAMMCLSVYCSFAFSFVMAYPCCVLLIRASPTRLHSHRFLHFHRPVIPESPSA